MMREDSALTDDVTARLKRFSESSEATAEAVAQDLVRVRMGGRMEVREVNILNDSLPPDLRERLERAVVEAVAAAQSKLATKMAEVLARPNN